MSNKYTEKLSSFKNVENTRRASPLQFWCFRLEVRRIFSNWVECRRRWSADFAGRDLSCYCHQPNQCRNKLFVVTKIHNCGKSVNAKVQMVIQTSLNIYRSPYICRAISDVRLKCLFSLCLVPTGLQQKLTLAGI